MKFKVGDVVYDNLFKKCGIVKESNLPGISHIIPYRVDFEGIGYSYYKINGQEIGSDQTRLSIPIDIKINKLLKIK